MSLFSRHLSASKRASTIAAAMKWRKAMTPELGEVEDVAEPTQMQLAESADVSRRTIAQAQRAEEHGLGPMIRDGSMSAKTADLIVKHDLDEQVVSGEMSVERARDLVADRKAERAAEKQTNPEPDDIEDRNDDEDPDDPNTPAEADAPITGETLSVVEMAEHIEQLEAEREMLLLGTAEDRERIRALTKENELLRAASTGLTEDIEALFRSKDVENSALKSELNILQRRFNEERETVERLRQQLNREKERNGRVQSGI